MPLRGSDKATAQALEVFNMLAVLGDIIAQCEAAAQSSGSISGVIGDLQDACDDAKGRRLQAGILYNNNQYNDAKEVIREASNGIQEVMLPEANVDFEPAGVSVTVSPFRGWVSIIIPSGTIGTTKEGEPLTTITLADAEPTTPNVVLAYGITPDGATFSQPITMIFHYLPANIPSGFLEEDLIVASWDQNVRKWESLPSSVNLLEHSITTSVDHLTIFAVLAPLPMK